MYYLFYFYFSFSFSLLFKVRHGQFSGFVNCCLLLNNAIMKDYLHTSIASIKSFLLYQLSIKSIH